MKLISMLKWVTIMLTLTLVACGGGPVDELEDALRDRAPAEDSDSDTTAPPQQKEVVVLNSPETILPVSASDSERIDQALSTGNPAYLPDSTDAIINRIFQAFAERREATNTFMRRIYGNGRIDYEPPMESQFVRHLGLSGGGYPLITGNDGKALASASDIGQWRTAGFGTNILWQLNDGNFAGYQQPMKRLLAWLIGVDDKSAKDSHRIRFFQVGNNTLEASRSWLLGQFPNWDVAHCAEPATLSSCLTEGVDLVVAGSILLEDNTARATALSALKSLKIPTLYIHSAYDKLATKGYGDNGLPLALQLDYDPEYPRGNHNDTDAAHWANYQEMVSQQGRRNSNMIESMLTRLYEERFTFRLNECPDHTDCINPQVEEEFLNAAELLRSIFVELDVMRFDLFEAGPGYEITKLLALFGDHYRSKIRYPMNNKKDSFYEFVWAWFTEHTVYNSRKHNPAQTDMGDFSRSDFSGVKRVNRTLEYTSVSRFTAAGVYAFPGQTVKVTRLDDSPVDTWVFFNSLRSASSKMFTMHTVAYRRPKYLQTPHIKIAPGETITLTSPFGGPVQVKFSTPDLPVKLRFENVGEHPFWDGQEDNAKITAALRAAQFDWVEIVTPGFQIHTTAEKFKKTMAATVGANVDEVTMWTTPAELAEVTMEYHYGYPLSLAGKTGDGVAEIAEVMGHVQRNGWQMKGNSRVLHVNADRASCGVGCSGNPYDTIHYFDPFDHASLHELGHSLQSFNLGEFGGHSATNFYAYYTKWMRNVNMNTSKGTCAGIQKKVKRAQSQILTKLLASTQKSNPYAFMNKQKYDGWESGTAMIMQLLLTAQHEGGVDNGWNLMPLLHIVRYNLGLATRNDESWEAQKGSLGFDQYSRTEARSIGGRSDFVLVAASYITQLDFSNFFDMWGLEVSEKAKAQVAGYRDVGRNFYDSPYTDRICIGNNDDNSVIAID